jgi:hypothetical protein
LDEELGWWSFWCLLTFESMSFTMVAAHKEKSAPCGVWIATHFPYPSSNSLFFLLPIKL